MTTTPQPAPRLRANEDVFPKQRPVDSPFTRGPARRPQPPAAPQPTPRSVPPTTVADAEVRFYRRYGSELIAALLGTEVATPETVADWIALAEAVRDVLAAREAAAGKVAPRR